MLVVAGFGFLGIGNAWAQGGGPDPASIIFHEDKNYTGRKSSEFNIDAERLRLSFGISSVEIKGGTWEVCQEENYGWRCLELKNRSIPDLSKEEIDGENFNDKIKSFRRIDNKDSVPARIVLFQNSSFRGNASTFTGDASEVSGFGVSSIRVLGGVWEICAEKGYEGECVKVSGNVTSLDSIKTDDGKSLNDRVSSLRKAQAGGGPDVGGGPDTDSGTGETVSIENPLKAETIPEILDAIAGFLYYLALAVVTVMVLWAGFQILTAAGSPEGIDKGKRTLLWAIIGTVVILIAGGIADIVGDILGKQTGGSSTSRDIELPKENPVPGEGPTLR